METLTTTDNDWAFIESKLPSNWRAQAKEHGILIHEDHRMSAVGGWMLRDPAVLLRLLLHYVVTNSALKTTVALAAATGLVDMSAVALHKWTRKAGGWIAALVAAMMETTARFAPERWAGYDVLAVDATTVQKPGAKGTTARVHYALRLTDLRAMAIHVGDATVGETLRNFAMAAGQLWIADRGYSNANSIAHAVAAKADVLIRFALGPLPLFDAVGNALDTRAKIQSVTAAGSHREFSVWVRPHKADPIQARLIVQRLPEDKAAEARKRLYKEHTKSEVSAVMLEMASYVVLITTVPRTRLTTLQLLAIYRLRWQLELSFKRDKSIAGLDMLPSQLPETIHCWICTKLLATQLARRIAESDEPFPPRSSATTPFTSDCITLRHTPHDPVVREIWRCTVLAWNTLRAGLLPFRMQDLPAICIRFCAHLARTYERFRPRAIERFRASLAGWLG